MGVYHMTIVGVLLHHVHEYFMLQIVLHLYQMLEEIVCMCTVQYIHI